MKAQLLILYSVCFVSACLTSLSSVAHGDVRIGIPFQEQSPASIAGDTLAVAIRPLVSDDNVRLLSAEQLDGSDGALKAVSAGAIEIAILPSVTIAEGQAPGMAIFDMPYLFDDLSEVSKFQSTYVGEALLGSISDPNVVALGYWNLSMNLLFGPLIRSAEDFNGWTVLTTTSTYGQESVKALGAKPISEVGNDVAFTAFRTGNIDAAELAPTSKFFKQPDAPVSGLYVSEVAFRPVVAVVVANASFWESLSPSRQVALRRSISEIGETITKESTDRDAIAILELQKLGLKAAVVSPPLLKTLRQDVRSSWFAVGGLSPWLQHGLDVLEQLRKPAATSPKRSDKSADRPIRVFFGTDRQLQESQPGLDYGNGRTGLSFGIAETHVTSTSPVGGRPHDRLAIRDIQSMGSAEFQQSLSAALRDSRIRDVVVFVHGYNTNFGDSVSAASVSLDTKFRGIPVSFSWPSDGVALRYNMTPKRRMQADPILSS
jgi:TRAP-type C4-dicarboxylate transport system substrate-binding protein